MRPFLLLILLFAGGTFSTVWGASGTLRPSTVEAITRAQEQMKAKAYKEAESTLDRCREHLGSAAYDRAYLQNVYGYLYVDLQRYDAALQAFTQAYESHRLEEETERNLLFNMAQLLAMLKRYDEAETHLLAWMKTAKKFRPSDYMLLATVEIQLHRYAAAAEAVGKAIAAAPVPVRTHYQTLYYLQYELEKHDAAVATLKKMIALFPPRKEDYLQLSGLLLQGNDTAGALTVLELAHLQGLLQRREELMRLAQLYVYAGVPLRAGQLLASQESAERHADAKWHMLEAQAWQQAREDDRALKAYAEAAARGDDRAYEAAAYLYAGRNDPDGVIDTVEKALAAGTSHADALRVLEGQALFDKGEYVLAKKVFDAVDTGGRHGKEARQWLDYLASRPAK